MKTLLQIVQQFCNATGLNPPLGVVSSTDSQIVQILALMNEGLDSLAMKPWAQLQQEATFTSTAVESQGALETIAPGFRSIIPDTFWNLTNKLPANGSISPKNTQILKVWGAPSAYTQFREVNGELHLIPAVGVGTQYRFEYNSQNLVQAADLTTKQYFTADTDVPLIPDNIIIADLRWRWKAEKELAYAENFRTFENLCKQALVNSATKTPLRMGSSPARAMPGIVVPLGSWQ